MKSETLPWKSRQDYCVSCRAKNSRRVGGGKDILTSDFRLVAATNRNLEKAVKENRFREDLYYRINVFPLYIPPLKERREDIPLLAHHFFTLYTARHGKSFDKIPQEMMEKLVRHDWPGNIRELENIIQRSVISSQGPKFHLSSLEIIQPKAARQIHSAHLKKTSDGIFWKPLKDQDGKSTAPEERQIS